MTGGTLVFFVLLGGAVFLLSQVLIVPAFAMAPVASPTSPKSSASKETS